MPKKRIPPPVPGGPSFRVTPPHAYRAPQPPPKVRNVYVDPSPDSSPEIVVESLTPPPERITMKPFGSEVPTKDKSPSLATYQALLSVFDEMGPEERFDFVELAFFFKDLPAEDRRQILEMVRARAQAGG